MSQQMYIDCRVSTSNGDAVRVMAMLDKQNDNLVISKFLPFNPPQDPYKGKTKEQIAIMKQIKTNTIVAVDNPHSFREWDMSFNTVENLDQAVRDYYSLARLGRLEIKNDIKALCDPKAVIEVRKTDMRGNVYEVNPDEVSNHHFAVLIACWAAVRIRATVQINEVEVEPTQRDIDTFSVPFSI